MARTANQEASIKPAQDKGFASAVARICEILLDFIDRMSKRWKAGDHVGAIWGGGWLMEGILSTMFLAVLPVWYVQPEAKSLLYMIFTAMVTLLIVILLAAYCGAPDDKHLARGQALRRELIHPGSFYQTA